MYIVLSAPSYSDGHRCKEVAGDIKIMAIRLSAKAQPCYPFLLFGTQEKSANTLLSLQQLVGIYSCFFMSTFMLTIHSAQYYRIMCLKYIHWHVWLPLTISTPPRNPYRLKLLLNVLLWNSYCTLIYSWRENTYDHSIYQWYRKSVPGGDKYRLASDTNQTSGALKSALVTCLGLLCI